MRRRAPDPPPRSADGREFTPAEVSRIRDLIAGRDIRRHPNPNIEALRDIHAAAGRRRGFMVWELDPVTDLEAAVAEELAGGLLPRVAAP